MTPLHFFMDQTLKHHRTVAASSFEEAWKTLLEAILSGGDRSSPRGKVTAELLDVKLTVVDALANIVTSPARGLNYRFMLAEWLWIAAGRADLTPLTRVNRRMAEFSDNGKTLRGAYGPRLHPQWAWLVDLLKRDPSTRQGVVSIWRPTPEPSRDVPCTLSLQFLRREFKRTMRLHGVVTMRSSDAWLGLPYDFFTFSMLLNAVAGVLDDEVGTLTFNMGSSHLYEEHMDCSKTVLAESSTSAGIKMFVMPRSHEVTTSPRLPGFPPAEKVLRDPKTHGYELGEPWDSYRRALWSNSSKEALDVLEKINHK